MDTYLIVRFLHIASAIIFVGGIFARQLVRSLAKSMDDVKLLAALNNAAGRIERLMVIPGNFAVIVFGVLLARETDAPIFGFLEGASEDWLLVSILLLLVGFLTVPLVFVPRGKKFDLVLNEALIQGEITRELRVALNDPVIRLMHLVEMAVVGLIVYLMVFRPF